MKIERPIYMQQLIDSKDNGLIKIVTGLRRVGKSYLLKTLFKEYLLGEGISGEPVVVFMSKSAREVAAFFGCIYAGCSYVPIDPEMPRFRTELIFKNLAPRAVICEKGAIDELGSYDYDGKIFCYEDMLGGADDAAMRICWAALTTRRLTA